MPRQSRRWHFFVEGERHETAQETLSGNEIKQLARCGTSATLYLEGEHDLPDRIVADGEHVHISGRTKHFYIVQPA